MTRVSLASGMLVVLAVGYLYGIVRANLLEPVAHFLFDAAVVGLYAATLLRKFTPEEGARLAELRVWLFVLMGWPLLLFLAPIQDPMIQVIGLRGNIFLIPFLLLGAQLDSTGERTLAIGLSCLNIVVFVVAAAQFVVGIEPFFPRSALTDIIYRSRDVAGGAYRLPATFSNSHAYGGAMVLSLPFLLTLLLNSRRDRLPPSRRMLILGGAATAIVGVFLAGARLPVVWLAVIAIVLGLSARMRFVHRVSASAAVVFVAVLVSSETRLQRFLTLADGDFVEERIAGSLNEQFVDLVLEYPLGNGLGGGGTSIPYFLRDRLTDGVVMENEYARILLELGVPGLLIWATFLFWALEKGMRRRQASDRVTWAVTLSIVASAFLGLGLLTSIPASGLLFIAIGRLVTPPTPMPVPNPVWTYAHA